MLPATLLALVSVAVGLTSHSCGLAILAGSWSSQKSKPGEVQGITYGQVTNLCMYKNGLSCDSNKTSSLQRIYSQSVWSSTQVLFSSARTITCVKQDEDRLQYFRLYHHQCTGCPDCFTGLHCMHQRWPSGSKTG